MKKLNKDEKAALKSEELNLFVQQYARRKGQHGLDPNDRSYDRKIQARVKKMSPIELDALLRLGDDSDIK